MKRLLLLAIALGLPRFALAVPGPDTTVVVGNSAVPGSVALARSYASSRQVPSTQVCLLDLPTTSDITLAQYDTLFFNPLKACLERAQVYDRIEAVQLIRGVPLRVTRETSHGVVRASLAAVVSVWDTKTFAGTRLLDEEPGRVVDCGGVSCYAARWRNPFTEGVFHPHWVLRTQSVEWTPMLVAALDGRSDEEAGRLLVSATEAERSRPTAPFVFMESADGARGVLDTTYDAIIAELTTRGITAMRVPFSGELTGQTFGALVVGTAQLGSTIEGDTFAPGSLVDNLTSFGAVPDNFSTTTEVQVSIARFVARGVAGVHGTTDEPLNNCFPSRRFLVDYVDGSTLVEAYFRNMPFAYWQNLVLGDVMAAPYANRPTVRFEGDGFVARGTRYPVRALADGHGLTIARTTLYFDNVEVASADGPVVEYVPPSDVVEDLGHPLLAVAQVADDGTRGSVMRPKGWATSIFITGQPQTDEVRRTPFGCICSAHGEGALDGLFVLLAVLSGRTRRRSCSSSRRSGRGPRASGPS